MDTFHHAAAHTRRPRRGRAAWPLGVLAALGVAGCDVFHRWDALVYRNRFDRADVIEVGTFGSLEECRAAARATMAELRIGEIGGYVCGENCMVKSGFTPLRMCARTAR